MSYSLSEHYGYSRLLRFSFPSIIGMIFTSLYTIVDGIFVSNVVGESAFAALNLIWPVLGILMAFGFMIGTGGSALISKTLGEGSVHQANEYFSMLVVFECLLGTVLSLTGCFFLPQLARMLGADGMLLEECLRYGYVLMILQPFVYLSVSFQSFFLAAARPKLGLVITLLGGGLNIVLDYVFMVPLKWGIAGAAWATGLNWILTGCLPVVYFLRPNSTQLSLIPFHWNFRALGRALLNGSSEMVVNLAISLTAVLYNLELLKYIGSAGVIAYGVLQYIGMLFLAVFFGYGMAVTPIIAYHYGAGNTAELHSLFQKSMVICGCACLMLTGLAESMAPGLAMIFVSYSDSLMQLTVHAIHIYSTCFLLAGLNIFTSSFFTALNDGPVSAAVSFLRTLVFQIGSVLVLPVWVGVNGIWWATTVSEVLASGVSVYFLVRLQKKYHY